MNKSYLLKSKHFLDKLFSQIKNLDYSIKSNDYESIYYKIQQIIFVLQMLEVEDCGSIGGFSEGQDSTRHIIKRLDFLLRKNNIDTSEINAQLKRLKNKNITD